MLMHLINESFPVCLQQGEFSETLVKCFVKLLPGVGVGNPSLSTLESLLKSASALLCILRVNMWDLTNRAHHWGMVSACKWQKTRLWKMFHIKCMVIHISMSHQEVVNSGIMEAIDKRWRMLGIPTVDSIQMMFLQDLNETVHVLVARAMAEPVIPRVACSANIGMNLL